MRGVRNAILIAFAFLLGIGQTRAGEFDSILRWRNVGPFRGGRALTIEGVPGEPDTFYFGAVAGGVPAGVSGVGLPDPES